MAAIPHPCPAHYNAFCYKRQTKPKAERLAEARLVPQRMGRDGEKQWSRSSDRQGGVKDAALPGRTVDVHFPTIRFYQPADNGQTDARTLLL